MKRIILSALVLTLAASAFSCGSIKESSSDKADISETAAAKVPTEADEDFMYGEHSSEQDMDYKTGEVSAEKSMEVANIKRSLKADSNGFLIKDGILYDYEGVSPKVEIPDGVERIEVGAFWSNNVVEALYIPSSVKEICPEAFWSCSNLKFVKAEEGLERIAGSAFWSCSGLEDVDLPASLTEFGDVVFGASRGVTIHAPVGSAAEKYANEWGLSCDNTYVEYQMLDRKNVIRGSQYAYGDFTEFTIPDNITSIESDAFEYCENLETIFIPANVQYIAPDAFEYCFGLKTVTIDGCREIRGEAFEYCESLHTVYINEGTESIGGDAFGYCRKLRDVYLPASITFMDKEAFSYTAPELTLHVPEGSYAEDYAISLNIPFDNEVSH